MTCPCNRSRDEYLGLEELRGCDWPTLICFTCETTDVRRPRRPWYTRFIAFAQGIFASF